MKMKLLGDELFLFFLFFQFIKQKRDRQRAPGGTIQFVCVSALICKYRERRAYSRRDVRSFISYHFLLLF